MSEEEFDLLIDSLMDNSVELHAFVVHNVGPDVSDSEIDGIVRDLENDQLELTSWVANALESKGEL